MAYGQILSRKLLEIPPLGCINLHASLLPKYRGAAPIRRALMNGDQETGVCVQKMVYQLDAGDVIDEVNFPISENLTFGELEEKLCNLSKELLLNVILKYQNGIPSGKPQDNSQVTFAAKILAADAQIHWANDARAIHNQIRAHSPRPGAWCLVQVGAEKRRLKILRTQFIPRIAAPGELISSSSAECIVAAQNGALKLLEVQPEGKKPMSSLDWLRGLVTPPKF